MSGSFRLNINLSVWDFWRSSKPSFSSASSSSYISSFTETSVLGSSSFSTSCLVVVVGGGVGGVGVVGVGIVVVFSGQLIILEIVKHKYNV